MNRFQIIQSDALEALRSFPSGVARCAVTSPPYYGLRDYGVRGQIGLEASPTLYIENLVAVFRELRRVLTDDGTLWLNLGDSYAGGKGKSGTRGAELQEERSVSGASLNRGYQTLGGANQTRPTDDAKMLREFGAKPKDLLMIPARVAMALQSDGWYLRSEIVWAKPNPMPESVKDRPTKSHEMIYLLSKSPKYYYDYKAILEPANYDGRKSTMMKGSGKYKNGFAPTDENPNTLHVKGHERWSRKLAGTNHAGDGSGLRQHSGSYDKETGEYLGHMLNGEIPARNRRDVWTVTTKPYKEAHFATFPQDLITPCVLAGSAKGDTVLDPFNGSGTTGAVALQHERNYIGIELNPAYVDLSHKRIQNLGELWLTH